MLLLLLLRRRLLLLLLILLLLLLLILLLLLLILLLLLLLLILLLLLLLILLLLLLLLLLLERRRGRHCLRYMLRLVVMRCWRCWRRHRPRNWCRHRSIYRVLRGPVHLQRHAPHARRAEEEVVGARPTQHKPVHSWSAKAAEVRIRPLDDRLQVGVPVVGPHHALVNTFDTLI